MRMQVRWFPTGNALCPHESGPRMFNPQCSRCNMVQHSRPFFELKLQCCTAHKAWRVLLVLDCGSDRELPCGAYGAPSSVVLTRCPNAVWKAITFELRAGRLRRVPSLSSMSFHITHRFVLRATSDKLPRSCSWLQQSLPEQCNAECVPRLVR